MKITELISTQKQYDMYEYGLDILDNIIKIIKNIYGEKIQGGYIFGGFVRDLLLDNKFNNIDIMINNSPLYDYKIISNIVENIRNNIQVFDSDYMYMNVNTRFEYIKIGLYMMHNNITSYINIYINSKSDSEEYFDLHDYTINNLKIDLNGNIDRRLKLLRYNLYDCLDHINKKILVHDADYIGYNKLIVNNKYRENKMLSYGFNYIVSKKRRNSDDIDDTYTSKRFTIDN